MMLVLALAEVPVRLVAQSGGLAVTPLLLDTLPGGVTVYNGESVPARLRVSLQDFEQAPDGSNRFLPLGTGHSTCGGRADLGVVPDVIAPGATVSIRVDVAAGPLCWGAVMVEASKDARPGNRVAVKYFYVPRGLTRAAEIVGLATGSIGVGRGLRIAVHSRGTAPVRAFGRVEFRDDTGSVVATSDVPEFGLLPGGERQVSVAVPSQLPGGRYVVLVILDVGAEDFVAAQAVLAIPQAR